MKQSLGSCNVAIGAAALCSTGSGHSNTAIGYTALLVNTGSFNTAVGVGAGDTITTGANNTLIGRDALPSSATVSDEFTLGDSNVTNLRCNDTSISSLSDLRDKENVEDIPHGLDFINALRPVKFDWNRRDGTAKGLKDYGFIAQELDQVEQDFGSA